MNAIDKALEIFRTNSGRLRSSEAFRLGISPRILYALRDSGRLVAVTRGVYQLADLPIDENSDLVQVALRIPKGVICLISALAFHTLTTQVPHAVYVALPLDSEKPRLDYPPIRLIWLASAPYNSGVEKHCLSNVEIKIFDREKTIADCFKYRNKIGLSIATEALKDGLAQGCNPKKILEYARVDRVEKILVPYLEMLS